VSIAKQKGVQVIITEKLACGHLCEMVYPMEDCDITLKTGPLTSIDSPSMFPDPSTFLSSLDRTLELSGKRGDVQYIGITAEPGRLICAQCGTVLFALNRWEDRVEED